MVGAHTTGAVDAHTTNTVDVHTTEAVGTHATGVVNTRTTGVARAHTTRAVDAHTTSVVSTHTTSAVDARTTAAVRAQHRVVRTRGFHVVPFPRTPDAPPSTKLIFSSLTPSEIRSVTVVGSRSGVHRGRLVRLSVNRGTAFVPAKPFASREKVTVSATLSSPAAGTAEGAPNATRLRYWFTVQAPDSRHTSATAASVKKTAAQRSPGARATTVQRPVAAKVTRARRSRFVKRTAARTQSFHSAPNIKPPVVPRTGKNPDTASGDIFLAVNNERHRAPEILDSRGNLVWLDPANGGPVFNLKVQTYEGKPVLTWWQGHVDGGYGVDGTDMILNTSYQTVAALHGGYGYPSNLHDFEITPQNTALVVDYVTVPANLSSLGGSSHGKVRDCVVQELDIKTGKVLWEWHALGHVPLRDSYKKPVPGEGYGYFHLNSVQELPNGNFLISSRNTWTIYEVSRATGKIIWRLGGKHSSFKMGPGTQFEWQHDAHLNRDGTLTLFDNASAPDEEKQSSAKELRLNMRTMTASLMHRYTHTPSTLAHSMGNMQILPNGNVFVGWGAAPYFSEYTAGGKQIWSARGYSYRAYRFVWHAQPTTSPAIAVSRRSSTKRTVYVSWNGATDVARWQLLAGPDPGHLSAVRSVVDRGFETKIPTGVSQRYLAVRALSASGKVLGTTRAIAG